MSGGVVYKTVISARRISVKSKDEWLWDRLALSVVYFIFILLWLSLNTNDDCNNGGRIDSRLLIYFDTSFAVIALDTNDDCKV